MMPSPNLLFSSFNFENSHEVKFNPSVPDLISDCLRLDKCRLLTNGAVVAYSGKYTGRSPKDKYIVRESSSEPNIWWGNNKPIEVGKFAELREKLVQYANRQKLYVIDTFAGSDPRFRIKVRFVVERPYHALFVKQLLIRPDLADLADFQPDWTVLAVSKRAMDPEVDGLPGEALIALNFEEQQVLIAGTEYAGELKKSVFTIMNYLLPNQGVLSMHCSANMGRSGDTALFFGLSGTGKTTLSADPERHLIGDDEHAWSADGIFNIEGGCYAKCINLAQEQEPQVWSAIRSGAILENVVVTSSGEPLFADQSLTENTRVAYPLDFIPNAVIPSIGGHPQNIFFLTCDAMGILPPISRLTPDQAMVHFMNGYTAKIAGTERGVTEPTLTFSTCFGQPFLPLPPKVYVELLREKIEEHKVTVWLINTGWTGGPYGEGTRIRLTYTRAMLRAVLDGKLKDVPVTVEPYFGLNVPIFCPDVPAEILLPRATWSDPSHYDLKAVELRERFNANALKYAD